MYCVYIDGTMAFCGRQHIIIVCYYQHLCTYHMQYLTSPFDPHLLKYSIPNAQRIIRCFPVSLQNALYPFMDSILGCYKDGTNNTRNCRYFGVVYYIARLCIWSSVMWTETQYLFSVAAVIIVIVGMSVAFIQPYKSAI